MKRSLDSDRNPRKAWLEHGTPLSDVWVGRSGQAKVLCSARASF